MPADDPDIGGGLFALLRERWMWWVIPLIIMGIMTLILAYLGQGSELAPVQYDLPTGPP